MGAIIALIPSIISGVTSIATYIQSVRSAAQQSGEWTTDMEALYQKMLIDAAGAPEWQPDKAS